MSVLVQDVQQMFNASCLSRVRLSDRTSNSLCSEARCLVVLQPQPAWNRLQECSGLPGKSGITHSRSLSHLNFASEAPKAAVLPRPSAPLTSDTPRGDGGREQSAASPRHGVQSGCETSVSPFRWARMGSDGMCSEYPQNTLRIPSMTLNAPQCSQCMMQWILASSRLLPEPGSERSGRSVAKLGICKRRGFRVFELGCSKARSGLNSLPCLQHAST